MKWQSWCQLIMQYQLNVSEIKESNITFCYRAELYLYFNNTKKIIFCSLIKPLPVQALNLQCTLLLNKNYGRFPTASIPWSSKSFGKTIFTELKKANWNIKTFKIQNFIYYLICCGARKNFVKLCYTRKFDLPRNIEIHHFKKLLWYVKQYI